MGVNPSRWRRWRNTSRVKSKLIRDLIPLRAILGIPLVIIWVTTSSSFLSPTQVGTETSVHSTCFECMEELSGWAAKGISMLKSSTKHYLQMHSVLINTHVTISIVPITLFVASWQSGKCCHTREISTRDQYCLGNSFENRLQILTLANSSFLGPCYFADMENKR